jgi:hypothetical protein
MRRLRPARVLRLRYAGRYRLFVRTSSQLCSLVVFGAGTCGVVALGCSAESALEADTGAAVDGPVSLVVPGAWQAVPKGLDPFGDRPADDTCPTTSYGIDAGLFGVYTMECRYLTATQPTLVALEPGDTVVIEVGYGKLYASEPATGHIAVALPGNVLWEKTFNIPGAPWFGTMEVPITAPVAQGVPILFHAHNHGANDYRLIRVERVRPDPTPKG